MRDRIERLKELLKDKQKAEREGGAKIKERLKKLERVIGDSWSPEEAGFQRIEEPGGFFFLKRVPIPVRPFPLDNIVELLPEGIVVPDISELVFLDNESIGLSGGVGTFAFLVGIVIFDKDEAVLEQHFLSDPGQERAFLQFISNRIGKFKGVVTYNGKSFDLPQLENRLRLYGLREPEWGIHLDLLHLTRRLFRGILESYTLSSVERGILNRKRTVDIPSHWVPRIYRQYLMGISRRQVRLVFVHNQEDILSLLLLLRRLVEALKNPEDHPQEVLFNLASLKLRRGLTEEAQNLISKIPKNPLDSPEVHGLRAFIAKKKRDWEEALRSFEAWTRSSPDLFLPIEEMAKIYEHRLKRPEIALSLIQGYLEKSPRENPRVEESLLKRMRRLERKVSSTKDPLF